MRLAPERIRDRRMTWGIVPRKIVGWRGPKQLDASALRSMARWTNGAAPKGINLSDGEPSLSRGVTRKAQSMRRMVAGGLRRQRQASRVWFR